MGTKPFSQLEYLLRVQTQVIEASSDVNIVNVGYHTTI